MCVRRAEAVFEERPDQRLHSDIVAGRRMLRSCIDVEIRRIHPVRSANHLFSMDEKDTGQQLTKRHACHHVAAASYDDAGAALSTGLDRGHIKREVAGRNAFCSPNGLRDCFRLQHHARRDSEGNDG